MNRLVDRITKGPAQLVKAFDAPSAIDVMIDSHYVAFCPGGLGEETQANAELIAEAFNAAHQSGRSPAELLADRDEAVAALRYISTHCDGRGQIAATESLAKLDKTS